MPVETITAAQITDPEAGRRLLAEAITETRELRETGRLTDAKIEQISRDLQLAQQKIAEYTARSERVETGPEAELATFQRADGSLILFVDAENRSAVVLKGGRREAIRIETEDMPDTGLLSGDKICGDWHRDLLQKLERRTLVRLHGKRREGRAYADSFRCDADIRRHLAQAPTALKRIFTDSSGQGAEWIPDVEMPLLWETAQAERKLEAAFPSMTVNAKTVIIPYLSRGLRPYKKGVPTTNTPGAYTASELSTAARTKVLPSLAVRYLADEDSSEDSILATEGIIRRALADALIDGVEDIIVNGDTAASHQDTIASWDIGKRWGTTGLGTADDHRRTMIGLRRIALAIGATASGDGSGAMTYDGAMAQRAKLSAPLGANAEDCGLITSWAYYLKYIINFSQVQTMEKYGANATVLQGEVSRLGGMPIFCTQFMGGNSTGAGGDALNASGVFDNSTLTYTGMLCVNLKRFIVMNRRGIQLERTKDIGSGVWEHVATVRKLFTGLDYDDAGWTSTSRVPVHFSYKLTA